MEKVLNYCDALNETYVDLSVSPRREKKLFNYDAFKEAWINACVHNKRVEKRPPAVFWFDDRLEIMSYGGIPKGMTKERFLSGETQPINEELMSIFLQCDIVEHSGHGVPIVVREYGEKAYKFNENSIIVTIPFDRTGFDAENGEINGEINLEEVVVRLIQDNPKINRKQLAVKTGVSERSIDRVIENLKKKGIIQGKTSNKNGRWILN